MDRLFNVSSSPHVKTRLTTGSVMFDVILCLLPTTLVGIWHFGWQAVMVIVVSIVSAVLSEFVFDLIVKKPGTIKDLSAVVTGLLLALCLPASVPLYVPFLGALFAVVIAKGLFGGLGHNFLNPALAGRAFLLISFSSVMTDYAVDGFSSATPLAEMASGSRVDVIEMLIGNTSGVIGNSVAALLIGGVVLWAMGGITFEIPVACLVSFTAFMALFGGKGFDAVYLLAHLAGGGIVMAAFFMATDPVTSPVTSAGQLVYGILVGVLGGVFRVLSSAADSTSYAVLISNMIVPLIDEVTVPIPFGFRRQIEKDSEDKEEKKSKFPIPSAAMILFGITLIAGIALGGVHEMTRDTIEEQQLSANTASYQEVVPDAVEFAHDDTISAAVDALGGEVYGTDFGNAYINDVLVGTDAQGNAVGYMISATSADGYEGDITLSIGISSDGTVNGISFTELNETAGMGMRCDEPEFKDQFAGVNTDAFILNRQGGSTANNEIDSVSGASTSSGAVVNAVNAALSFFAENIA